MVGEKLKSLLEAKNMKPGTLATKTGISKSTIYSIIKRNNKNVDFSVMEKIADELEVPVEYFHDRESVEETKNQLAPDEAELEEFVSLFEKLTSDQRQFIISSMKGILSERE